MAIKLKRYHIASLKGSLWRTSSTTAKPTIRIAQTEIKKTDSSSGTLKGFKVG